MERIISKGIVNSYFNKLNNNLSTDVAIIGGGPSGLIAAYYLSKAGKQVTLFDRKLAPGGGMWGGAMMFNDIIVQEDAIEILDELKINYSKIENGYYVADSVESTSSLIYQAVHQGTTIFNLYSIEDVVFQNNSVAGIVANWSIIHKEGLHVDPLVIMAKCTLDATGHPSEIANIISSKNEIRLATKTGKVIGERSLSVELGEIATVENTKEIFPGLFVSGMAANGVSGSFRMGPIFGGMLNSGKKAAKLILNKLEGKNE